MVKVEQEEPSTLFPEEYDTDSLPEASDDLSTPPEDWPLTIDASRWIDARDKVALDAWGSPRAAHTTPFDPASAFQEPSASTEKGDSGDSNKSIDGWDSPRNTQGSSPKRQRLEPNWHLPTAIQTGSSGLEQGADDEERSSEDFQGPEIDRAEDVIKVLGPENVRRLASMPESTFYSLASESGSDEEGMSDEDSSYKSSEPDDVDQRSQLQTCVNCTSILDYASSVCLDCGHNAAEDSALFCNSGTGGRHPVKEGQATKVMLASDDRMALHEEGKRLPHPERPDRIKAVIARLSSTGLAGRCLMVPCREATDEEIAACHTESLIARVKQAAEAAGASGRSMGVDRTYLTGDTFVRPHTFSCAALAAGGCVEVATAVTRGEVTAGAAIVRPPGHHAESSMAMGFCFFNNAAVAARAAQKAGAKKVLILDWDVHHGNGTQHIFENDPSVLYMSIHRWDGGHFFPGTGGPSECGKGAGEGFTVNIPWPDAGMGNGDYLAAFNHIVIPIAHQFAPDIIIVSAGFDAAAGDPLGGCELSSEAFAMMTAQLGLVAPLAVLLEGGYNLAATAAGTEATLRVLLGERPPPLPRAGLVSPLATMTIQLVARKQAKYWKCLKPLVDTLSFNPYVTPFSEPVEAPSSPRPPVSPRGAGSRPSQLGHSLREVALPAKPGHSADPAPALSQAASPRSRALARAAIRPKFCARRHGKGQRRLQYMHALHLVALRHRLKAVNAVNHRLARAANLRKGFLSRDASRDRGAPASPRKSLELSKARASVELDRLARRVSLDLERPSSCFEEAAKPAAALTSLEAQ